ncbi:MAG TPA: carboxypeptidase-like regulatory domain-containing protein [Solirubrobacterales bacterium]|nr:carboxypeptidase-like regulatory domain-containing protein [Solirubrobacterales bacterium]
MAAPRWTYLPILVSALMLCMTSGAPASTAAATGSISGKAIDGETQEGIPGLAVCAFAAYEGGPWGGCTFTNGAGEYTVASLESGTFDVVFDYEAKSFNYLEVRRRGVRLGDGESIGGIDAELEPGGQITGKVTDVETSTPVAGVAACVMVDLGEGRGLGHCSKSESDGTYDINSLPTGAYVVEFRVEGSPNYITQYYNGKSGRSEAEWVSVTAGAVTENIDAPMHEGIQISGLVTEAGTGNPIHSVGVCALDAFTESTANCAPLGLDGTYSIAGLPLGTYVVSFAVDREEDGVLFPDGYVRQYYDEKTTFAEGARIGGAVPAIYTGIDAHLVKGDETFPDRADVAPFQFVPSMPGPAPSTTQRKCRKHFRRRRIKGTVRCVKIHRKRHRTQGRGGHRRPHRKRPHRNRHHG